MKDCRQFYINGKWVSPTKAHDFQVINPASEEPVATISLGNAADVDHAVVAAKSAFESYSETTLENRLAFLHGSLKFISRRVERWLRPFPEKWVLPYRYHSRRRFRRAYDIYRRS